MLNPAKHETSNSTIIVLRYKQLRSAAFLSSKTFTSLSHYCFPDCMQATRKERLENAAVTSTYMYMANTLARGAATVFVSPLFKVRRTYVTAPIRHAYVTHKTTQQ